MAFINALKHLVGDATYDYITKNAIKLQDGLGDARDQLWWNFKQQLKDTPDAIEKSFDDLETFSGKMKQYSTDQQNLYDDIIQEKVKGLDTDTNEALGRYFHKVGAGSELFGKMVDDSIVDDGRLLSIFDRLEDVNHAENMDMVGRWMNDEYGLDRSIYDSYKNGDAFFQDIILPMFDGLQNSDSLVRKQARQALRAFMDDHGFKDASELIEAYDNMLYARAWQNFSPEDKARILSAYNNPHLKPIIDDVIHYSDEIKGMDSTVSNRDRILNYTRRTYQKDTNIEIHPIDDALAMTPIYGDIISRIKIGGKEFAKVLPRYNMGPQRAQGVVSVDGQHARGSIVNFEKQQMEASPANLKDIKKNGLDIETFIDKRTGQHVPAGIVKQNYLAQKEAYQTYLNKLEEYNKTKTVPKNAEELVGYAKGKGIEAHTLINDALIAIGKKPTNRMGILNAFHRTNNPELYLKMSPKAREAKVARDKEILEAIDDFLRTNADDFAEYGTDYPVEVLKPSLDDYFIGNAVQPMSDAMQVAKGRHDDVAFVVSQTIGSIHHHRLSEKLLEKLKDSKYTRVVTDSITNITKDVGKQPLFIKLYDWRYDPALMEWESYISPLRGDIDTRSWLRANEEILDKHYIRIDREGVGSKVDADYVHKNYAAELMGYEHWKITDGLGWKAELAEEMWKHGVDIVRTNISIKHPAVLMNNTIAGVMMQISDDIPMKLAFQNTLDSFKEIRRYHDLKAEIFRLEDKYGARNIKGAALHEGEFVIDEFGQIRTGDNSWLPAEDVLRYRELTNERKNSLIFKAFEDGVMKSFLDEGLWDRVLRQNPDASLDESLIKNIFLTEDSKWGVNVRKWHDYSDMMNRLAVYKYYHTQATPETLEKLKLLNNQDIKLRIDQMFVNYNRLLPSMVAAARRGGSIPFAAWFMRAPSFLIKQVRQHPVRSATLLATYELVQSYLEDDVDLLHTDFEDSYVGPIHADSKVSHNVLRPGNWLDMINPVGLDPSTWIPQYMEKATEGLPDAVGITTRDHY